ncbi:hypothetical protein C8F01DRAFT_61707 [Mycena amicta]|nr:hypothetical protein C8F01DRAFT_61707 [Mycena amicta]
MDAVYVYVRYAEHQQLAGNNTRYKKQKRRSRIMEMSEYIEQEIDSDNSRMRHYNVRHYARSRVVSGGALGRAWRLQENTGMRWSKWTRQGLICETGVRGSWGERVGAEGRLSTTNGTRQRLWLVDHQLGEVGNVGDIERIWGNVHGGNPRELVERMWFCDPCRAVCLGTVPSTSSVASSWGGCKRLVQAGPAREMPLEAGNKDIRRDDAVLYGVKSSVGPLTTARVMQWTTDEGHIINSSGRWLAERHRRESTIQVEVVRRLYHGGREKTHCGYLSVTLPHSHPKSERTIVSIYFTIHTKSQREKQDTVILSATNQMQM